MSTIYVTSNRVFFFQLLVLAFATLRAPSSPAFLPSSFLRLFTILYSLLSIFYISLSGSHFSWPFFSCTDSLHQLTSSSLRSPVLKTPYLKTLRNRSTKSASEKGNFSFDAFLSNTCLTSNVQALSRLSLKRQGNDRESKR